MADPQAGTAAVESQYLRTITIHGREFQQYSVDHLINLVPTDEQEADRLIIQHGILDMVFDGRLVFPPITSLQNVLDCGYGTASWAVEVAETHPDCNVIGIDISPQMKVDETPENFWPQLDDLNRSFTFRSNTFDLVHSQLVAGGINKTRWPHYMRDIFRVLKPGGWVQMVDCYYMCQSDNGSITHQSALRRWSTKYIQSLADMKDPRAPLQLQNMCNAAGLVSVESRMIPLPLCEWSSDARQQRIGRSNKDNVHQALRTLSLYPFTMLLGMNIEEFNDLIVRAREEAVDPRLKAYFPLYVCIGRKPCGQ